MAKGKSKDRKAVETLNYLWAAGLAITLGVAFGIYSWGKIGGFTQELRLLIEILALIATTVVLFVRYLTATHRELGLLAEYLNGSSAPRIGPSVYYAIFGLALVFGVLIATAHVIILYSAIILAYNIVDLWSGWLVRRNIAPLLEKKLSRHLSPEERDIVITIRDYYLGNPTFERGATLMFVDWIAFSLALVFHFTKLAWCRDLAYGIVILNLLAGEYVIYRWRRRRDQQIATLENPSGVVRTA